MLSKSSKRSSSILHRNSEGRESSSSGVLSLSLGEGSEVESTDWLFKGFDSITGLSLDAPQVLLGLARGCK